MNHFQRGSLNVVSRHLFADVISLHNGNMKHASAIEFDSRMNYYLCYVPCLTACILINAHLPLIKGKCNRDLVSFQKPKNVFLST